MRTILAAFGALLIVGGFFVLIYSPISPFGLWMIIAGVVLLVVSFIEVMRYRSEAAEATRAEPGPGGGEKGPLDRRFRPTDEVFVDPTTQQRMRVYLDGRTGERRYVAEG